ncbi:MAG TPA: hypothetical protein VHN15_12810, partial [Thermoanaerobaculia bacterium]|nr:hypothetical protein [Thermoanaerobaculia bacterium]
MSRIQALPLWIALLALAGPTAAEPAATGPTILLRPSRTPEERARLAAEQGERRKEARRDLAEWRRRHDAAVGPLLRAVDEAVASLRISRGPYSANVGYAVQLEVERLRTRGLPPLPDPALQAEWDRAVAEVEEGAGLCLQRRPTLGQLRLASGRERLQQVLAGAEPAFAPHRLFAQPPCGPGCAGTARPGRRTPTGATSRRVGARTGPAGRGRQREPLDVPKLPALKRR